MEDVDYDVFLSYTVSDREFALRLVSDLERAGVRVWIDFLAFPAGASVQDSLRSALNASRFLVAVMSPDYFRSAWAQQEWQYVLASEIADRKIRLIPLLYRDCEIPAPLTTKRWIDFRNHHKYDAQVAQLIASIGRRASVERVSGPTGSPTPGERVEDLSPAMLSELKTVLSEAVELFRAKPMQDMSPRIAETMKVEDDLCFIVMPFSVEPLNIVYEDFVRPTIADRCHLRPERGDDVFGSNVIMDDIANSIRRARLIIADLTGRNANVFYEVGIAHALNKPALLMTQSIEDIPFDLRHRRALIYEYSPRGCKKLEHDLYENVQGMLSSQRTRE